jgi:hypothetical protein
MLRPEWVPNVALSQIVTQRLVPWHTLTHVGNGVSSHSRGKVLDKGHTALLGAIGRFSVHGHAGIEFPVIGVWVNDHVVIITSVYVKWVIKFTPV